jgi:hypothetical protein
MNKAMTQCAVPYCSSTFSGTVSGIYVCGGHSREEVDCALGKKGGLRTDRRKFPNILPKLAMPDPKNPARIRVHEKRNKVPSLQKGKGDGIGLEGEERWILTWDILLIPARQKICKVVGYPMEIASKPWCSMTAHEKQQLYVVNWCKVLKIPEWEETFHAN